MVSRFSFIGMSWTWAGNAGRAIFAGWCILGLVLTSCYTSKLTSLLVGVTPLPPFTSVREMLAHDEYRWGILGGTKLVQILRVSVIICHAGKTGIEKEESGKERRKKEMNKGIKKLKEKEKS